MKRFGMIWVIGALAVFGWTAGCGDDEEGTASVKIKNDFNNPDMAYQPPWTICESSYLGVEFGEIGEGETSSAHDVSPGLDYVLMVAAWNDPDCAPEHCLPLASKNEEEAVDGQTRTIALNMPNHQGPCPPEGTAPIPEAQYNRILELWPDYDFKPYDQRTENTQCVGDDSGDTDADGGVEADASDDTE